MKSTTCALAALACLLTIGQANAADECWRVGGRYHLTSPGPWDMTAATEGGRECRSTFHSFGNVIFERLYLVAPPKSGKVRLQSGGYFYYRPNTGFRGDDVFRLRVCGTEGGFKGCTDINMRMLVR